jgi:hypothetical protein
MIKMILQKLKAERKIVYKKRSNQENNFKSGAILFFIL